MSIQPDWSKAPEGATHWCDESDTEYACWLRRNEDGSLDSMLPSHGAWQVAFVDADTMRTTTPRPAAWTGEGLPPVGTVCEFVGGDENGFADDLEVGAHVCIIAHFDVRPGVRAAAFTWERESGETNSDWALGSSFRPARTPEQIAAEEREKAIAEMCSLCPYPASELTQIDCAALYDAGCRLPQGGAQ